MIRTVGERLFRYRELFMIFLTGFTQVCLVAMNTVFIAKGKIIPMFLVSFIIGLVWIYNIKNTIGGSIWNKLLYCFGAATGTVIGFMLANSLITRI